MEIHKNSKKPKKLLEENKVKGFTLSNFKTHCKATLIKLCETGQIYTNTSMEWNRGSRTESRFLTRVPRQVIEEKIFLMEL